MDGKHHMKRIFVLKSSAFSFSHNKTSQKIIIKKITPYMLCPDDFRA